ncbi:MAG: response regulator [Thermodesulfobacteriota bacterium]
MNDIGILENKKILLVDDEPDVLETIKELLYMCVIDAAMSFETAEILLNRNTYDVAVLDIMGVKGYDLLEIANQKGIPALMLTANALSPDNFSRSIMAGAKAYIPKEKMSEIAVYLADFLRYQSGQQKHFHWFFQLRAFFESQFGKDWIEKYEELKAKYGLSDDE